MSKAPFAAIFSTAIAAEAAASVRNGIVIAMSGSDIQVDEVRDWYWRDDEGRPKPAEWRDLVGQVRVPRLEAAEAAA